MKIRTDEVDTSQLLKSLEETSRSQTLPDCSLETFHIRRFAEAHFIKMVRLHFVQFFDNSRVVHW